jgi:hypothetical protein
MVALGYEMKPTEEDAPRPANDDDASKDDASSEDNADDKIEAAVNAVVNDLDRDDWIRFGQALASATGKSGLGHSLWLDFSNRWTGGSNSDRAIRQAWDSFHPRSVSVSTLYWYADRVDRDWRSRLYLQRRQDEEAEQEAYWREQERIGLEELARERRQSEEAPPSAKPRTFRHHHRPG